MKLPLILTVALSTASYLHFIPSGQQITREIIKQANQIPWDLSSLITLQSKPAGARQVGDFKACSAFFFKWLSSLGENSTYNDDYLVEGLPRHL